MLTWEDADGDEVAIGTDEHLALALDEMPGPIYKFKARVEESDDVATRICVRHIDSEWKYAQWIQENQYSSSD